MSDPGPVVAVPVSPDFEVTGRQTALPTRFPMPAVTAMAAAPQNATRAVARGMAAPPALAPSAPRTARKTNEAAETE